MASIAASVPLNRGSGMLRRGDTIEVVTAGSGGYGPPAVRDPQAVTRDFAEGRISQATLRDVYRI
jgi:N-methylhydantoinase B